MTMHRNGRVCPPPLFVIGSPRSGTTLLRLMLTSHPALVIPPECGFVMWLYPRFGAWTAREYAVSVNRLLFAEAVSASRKFETWGLSVEDLMDALEAGEPQGFGEACACVYRLFAQRAGKAEAAWGDKNNHYLSSMETLKSIFPDARFLHIVRDGRDVACSYREVMEFESDSPYRPSLPVQIADIAARWASDVRTIGSHMMKIGTEATFELRYEDLTAEPQSELRRVCNWLGIPFADEMLQFHRENNTGPLEPSATLDWKKRTLAPVGTGTVGRHATMLSKTDAEEFVSIASTELMRFGYLH